MAFMQPLCLHICKLFTRLKVAFPLVKGFDHLDPSSSSCGLEDLSLQPRLYQFISQ